MDPTAWQKVEYGALNAKQKENRNFHRIAAILSGYGVDCARLENDWGGADFLAIDQDDIVRVQLKARLTINKKYCGKNLWIAWPSNGGCYFVPHKVLIELLGKIGSLDTKSWKKEGRYSRGQLSKKLRCQLQDYYLES